MLSFGPQVVIDQEFGDIPDVAKVIIYGSWAERYAGSEGREPGDVDVMVIGKPVRHDVYEAADQAQARLGITVNPTVRSIPAWEDNTDTLVVAVKNTAYVIVVDHESPVV